MEEKKRRVLQLITSMYGVKDTQLSAYTELLDIDEPLEVVDILVEEGKLLQLQYQIGDRIKSFYLPKHTKFLIEGKELN